jgi:cardiolipin synthase C
MSGIRPVPAVLADVLAKLAARLPPDHLAAWIRLLRETPGPDAGIQARLIDAKPGYAIGAKAAMLAEAWLAADPHPPGTALALAPETAARMHARHMAHRSDVVISGPGSGSAPIRLTSAVITELIRDCRQSLLIVSLAAFGVIEVVRELEQVAQRGVHIDLVLESTAAHSGTLRRAVEASAAFESNRHHATFWEWPANHRPVVGTSRAALHAKLIAADQEVALVGSANLTDRALASNLELGVILRDPDVVRRIVGHFLFLIKPGTGSLEPLKA